MNYVGEAPTKLVPTSGPDGAFGLEQMDQSIKTNYKTRCKADELHRTVLYFFPFSLYRIDLDTTSAWVSISSSETNSD